MRDKQVRADYKLQNVVSGCGKTGSMQDEKTSFLQLFTFIDPGGSDSLDVHIPQMVDPQYGMYVWPSAPVLAQFIWHHRTKLSGKKVLELGAGTSLPGVVASKLGADVTLTDALHLPKCLENCLKSCQANNTSDIKVQGVTWGQFTPDLVKLNPDIIIASDCFYATEDFENILITVSYLLAKNPNTEFWTTYQLRSTNWTIEMLLQKWKLRGRKIPLMSFNADSHTLAGTELPGDHSIQMFVIRSIS